MNSVTETPSEASARLTGKKIFVSDSISCQSSRALAQRYRDYIISHGCEPTERLPEADFVLIDTCAFNATAEQRSIEHIQQTQDLASHSAKVIVCGCLTAINPKKLVESYRGEFFTPRNEQHLANILGLDEMSSLERVDSRVSGRRDYSYLGWRKAWIYNYLITLHRINNSIVRLDRVPVFRRLLYRSPLLNPAAYVVRISEGCHGNCAFCTIPLAKGKTRSFPLGLIIEKVRSVVADGVRDIVLTSEDVGAYGYDLKINLVHLLKELHNLDGDFGLHLDFFDPRWLKVYGAELLPVLRLGRIKYFQLPLQSGSNAVLKRMYRAYRIDEVIPIIEQIKRENPRISLTTDIITGFPGETEEDFAQSLAIVERDIFSHFVINAFSPRPGAAAVDMPDQIPDAEKDRRAAVLQQAANRSKLRQLFGPGRFR